MRQAKALSAILAVVFSSGLSMSEACAQRAQSSATIPNVSPQAIPKSTEDALREDEGIEPAGRNNGCNSPAKCVDTAVVGPNPDPPSPWKRSSQAQYGKKKVVIDVEFTYRGLAPSVAYPTSVDPGIPAFFLTVRAEDLVLTNWLSTKHLARVTANWKYGCKQQNGTVTQIKTEAWPQTALWTDGTQGQFYNWLKPTSLQCNGYSYPIVLSANFSAERWGGPSGIITFLKFP